MTHQNSKSVIYWLYTIMAMVFAMVFIGGITRLTDSGLSMVDWKPLMGAIPPLNEVEWQAMFDKYKAFPEYQKINYGMSLSEFKQIFFWEYFHRLFGRLIGVVYFFPFIYFIVKKKITGTMRWKIFLGFILGGLQGLMGWYMVKSGLVNRPDVSQYRLCAHLLLAFLIIGYLYFLTLQLKNPLRKLTLSKPLKYSVIILLILVTVQVAFGAFVAGLDAGLTHNTFPKMGRTWLPNDAFMLSPFWVNIFENPVLVQFIHRTIAWLVVALSIFLFFKRKLLSEIVELKAMYGVLGMLAIQFSLGVITLVMVVPLFFASMHQLGALLLFLLCVRLVFLNLTQEVVS